MLSDDGSMVDMSMMGVSTFGADVVVDDTVSDEDCGFISMAFVVSTVNGYDFMVSPVSCRKMTKFNLRLVSICFV